MRGIFKDTHFENAMTRTQTVLGWVYFALHIIGIPLLLSLWAQFAENAPGDAVMNGVYYGIGLAFTLTVMLRFLRAGFDTLLDNLPRCVLALVAAVALDYCLSFAVTAVLLLLQEASQTPNNKAVMSLAGENYGLMRALAVFIAPLVEETLFRGVVFGSLRGRSRALAYIVSVALFSLCHVWQYALAALDWRELLYAVQYIPVSFALAWCYERSGTIWTPIFMHMGINALSFAVLSAL